MKSAAIVAWLFPPGERGGFPISAVSNEGLGAALRDYEAYIQCRESVLGAALQAALEKKPA